MNIFRDDSDMQTQREIWNSIRNNEYSSMIGDNSATPPFLQRENTWTNTYTISTSQLVLEDTPPSFIISEETTIKIGDFEITGKEMADLLRSMQDLKQELQHYKQENKELKDQLRFLEEI